MALVRVAAGLVGLGLLVGLLAGCSGGGVPPHGCSPEHHDPFDPRSVQHLLPGAVEPPYSTNPPTSGAHRVGYYPRGVVPVPVVRPVQVALLEVGFVIVQYRPGGPGPGLGSLATLTTNPLVTVAPNPDLPAPVVATAWLFDQRCGDAGPTTVSDLGAFVAKHAGKGPQLTIPLSKTSPGGVR